MNPSDYDAWYDSERGRWIGETEFQVLSSLLAVQAGERILDVGCGTGWFTRRMANLPVTVTVTGIDLNAAWLAFAQAHDPLSVYLQGDALNLPFADGSFDAVFSVAALCFVPDWAQALKEMLRVTRKRFVLGLLNRNSLLWREKGMCGGSGAYGGAHWHTAQEIRRALASLPVDNIRMRSAVFLPGGSGFARKIERLLPAALPYGSFIAVAGNKLDRCPAA